MMDDFTRRGQVIAETWDSFWGDLLLRRFHKDNPERWSAREAKAEWVAGNLGVPRGCRIVDLGCGDGLLDICLAQRGYRVAAVDRIASLLAAAREEADARGVVVDFVSADLRSYDFGGRLFDGAIFFDTLGLMDRAAEVDILSRLRSSLAPDAQVAIDWPREASDAQWERRFPDGLLEVTASYDPAARLQTINLEFRRSDGRVIVLRDPYAPLDHLGIRRRLYTLAEAQSLLREAGYQSHEVGHYRGAGYHMLIAAPTLRDGTPTGGRT
jgi:SAM-dependent methyltransferase